MTLAAVWLALAFCIAAEVGRELCFKRAAQTGGGEGLPAHVFQIALSLSLWLGIGLWAFEAAAWVWVLQWAPLGWAFPVMALTFAAVPLAGHVFLNERLSAQQKWGVALITLGALMVGLSGH